MEAPEIHMIPQHKSFTNYFRVAQNNPTRTETDEGLIPKEGKPPPVPRLPDDERSAPGVKGGGEDSPRVDRRPLKYAMTIGERRNTGGVTRTLKQVANGDKKYERSRTSTSTVYVSRSRMESN
jgi:hypothetical protein